MIIQSIKQKEFSVQRLVVRCEVVSRVVLNEHKGSALRGMLFNSLRKAGCSHRELKSCRPCPLVEVCPVSFLLAPVDDTARRGGDVPRPFAIQPPLEQRNIYEPGDAFEFGLTLFARSVNFLPYLVVGLGDLERDGLGAKYEYAPGHWRRGTLRVRQIAADNPINGEEQSLFEVGKRGVEPPNLPVTMEQIAQSTRTETGQLLKIKLDFKTPTRLIAEGKPQTVPHLPILAQRLIERLSSLSREYGGQEILLDFGAIMAEAAAAILTESRVEWATVRSYSRRQEQDLSLSGFVGAATYVGQFTHLLPLLRWGQLIQVGKDVTKGNGWYTLSVDEVQPD